MFYNSCVLIILILLLLYQIITHLKYNTMTKLIALSQTVYNLYWNKHLQLHTTNEDIIKLFLLRAIERGDSLNAYHINSNLAAGYNVEKFVTGEQLPMCWQVI